MQNIASEMNLSETAFVFQEDKNSYRIRFFTPTSEIDLCWHATLSSAHVLFSKWLFKWEKIKFYSKGWNLFVSKSNGLYSMEFPTWETVKKDDLLNDATSITGISGIKEIHWTESKWNIFVIDSIESLKSLAPDFTKMKGSLYWNLVVTCAWDNNYDYYSRCFVTDCWINEDPVTWSIECALAPFWNKKLWKKSFKTYQCSERGLEKFAELINNKVLISGYAVTVFEAVIGL